MRIVLQRVLGVGAGCLCRLQKYGRFTEAETGRYISDLVGAFQELERKNIIHRDIKPSGKQREHALRMCDPRPAVDTCGPGDQARARV